MSAKKTGGHGASQRAKDQARAAALKSAKVVRRTQQCVICNKNVLLSAYPSHIATHR